MCEGETGLLQIDGIDRGDEGAENTKGDHAEEAAIGRFQQTRKYETREIGILSRDLDKHRCTGILMSWLINGN